MTNGFSLTSLYAKSVVMAPIERVRLALTQPNRTGHIAREPRTVYVREQHHQGQQKALPACEK
jgi:hypothetical protein